MKVLVCGGRDFPHASIVAGVLSQFHNDTRITAVVNGAANGVDRFSSQWAKAMSVALFEMPAEWGKHGRAAGPIRNAAMLEQHPDIALVIAFPGGRGTADMVSKAKAKGIEVREIVL